MPMKIFLLEFNRMLDCVILVNIDPPAPVRRFISPGLIQGNT